MAPQLEILRNGDDWKLPIQDRSAHHRPISTEESSSSRRATDRFNQLAREHGSAAIWLPETGYLITEDPAEAAKDFPYEQWRDLTLKETGRI